MKVIEAQSVNERIESRIKAAEKLHKPWANIEAVRTRPEGSHLLKERFYGANLVTSAGDVYYAQKAAGVATPTPDDFGSANNRLELRTTATAVAQGDTYGSHTWVTATRKTVFTGYPTTSDSDADNTATDKAQKVTWRYDYTTGDFNQLGITGGGIHAAGTGPVTGTPLLSSFLFASSFDKTSNDTLKVIINHDFEGS